MIEPLFCTLFILGFWFLREHCMDGKCSMKEIMQSFFVALYVGWLLQGFRSQSPRCDLCFELLRERWIMYGMTLVLISGLYLLGRVLVITRCCKFENISCFFSASSVSVVGYERIGWRTGTSSKRRQATSMNPSLVSPTSGVLPLQPLHILSIKAIFTDNQA